MWKVDDASAECRLQVYARIARTRALGPGLRYGVWVQGCPLRCPGCMTPDAQSFTGGEDIAIAALAQEILALDDIEGLTISGGEPFAQAAGLATLMQHLRAQRDLGLILYSGYPWSDLQHQARHDAGVAALLGAIDLLIDGPYQAQYNDGAPLRGSSNQGIRLLTERYRAHLSAYAPDQTRAIEVHVALDERLLVGIPSARQLAWWQGR